MKKRVRFQEGHVEHMRSEVADDEEEDVTNTHLAEQEEEGRSVQTMGLNGYLSHPTKVREGEMLIFL